MDALEFRRDLAPLGRWERRGLYAFFALLIVFGVIALAAGELSYTKREKIIDLGPIQATTEHQKTIPLSPIVGIAAVAGGVVLVVAGARTRV